MAVNYELFSCESNRPFYLIVNKMLVYLLCSARFSALFLVWLSCHELLCLVCTFVANEIIDRETDKYPK